MSDDEQNDNQMEISLKILLLGDSEVGKTTLLLKYVDNIFQEEHIATIGVEYKDKYIYRDQYKIRLKIWDTAGEERFRSIAKNIYRNAEGILYVYDITKKQSFINIKNWIQEIEGIENNIKAVILGNKIDLEKERNVSFEALKEFGEKQNMPIMETSAKTGTNVEEAFGLLVDELLKNKSHEEIIKLYSKRSRSDLSISKKPDSEAQKKKCCF